ncbi:unnamed protein product, partial [Phaeothamnion confervicola]
RPHAGDYPDVHWRALTREQLRQHPHYVSLPEQPSQPIRTAADYPLIPQCSEAWEALHRGRLTTSTAASCLGFYEPSAAKLLGIPRGLAGRERASNAFLRLRTGPPPGGYEAAASKALAAEAEAAAGAAAAAAAVAAGMGSAKASEKFSMEANREAERSPWVSHKQPGSQQAGSFALQLEPVHQAGGISRRRRRHYHSSTAVRLDWGSAQEASALLAVVNHLYYSGRCGESGPGRNARGDLFLCEVGMYCGGPLDPARLDDVWLGASPDAVLCRKEGSMAVVEVKNRSPFYDAGKQRRGRGAAAAGGRFGLRDEGPGTTLGTWHVPQLMLHMHCAGVNEAWLLNLSATRGAALLLLRRDDAYLAEMLYFMREFVEKFVRTGRAPKPDFFADLPRYKTFLHRTRRLAAAAMLVRVFEHPEVQRAGGPSDSLFLD